MSDDDPIEHGISVAMTGAAALSRTAEVLIRHAQELKARAAAVHRENAAELQLQLDARAEAAAASWVFGAEIEKAGWLENATPEEIAHVVHASHAWAEIDPEKFDGHAERLRERLVAAYGVDLREAWQDKQNAEALAELAKTGVEKTRGDLGEGHRPVDGGGNAAERSTTYDAPEARAERAAALQNAGGDQVAVKARTVADQLNAHDPRTTAAAKSGRKGPAKAATRGGKREHSQQRGR